MSLNSTDQRGSWRSRKELPSFSLARLPTEREGRVLLAMGAPLLSPCKAKDVGLGQQTNLDIR